MAAQTLRFQAPVSNIGPRERFFKGESLANVCFLAKNGRFWKKEFWSAPIYKVNSQQLEYRLITFSDLVLIIFKKAIF